MKFINVTLEEEYGLPIYLFTLLNTRSIFNFLLFNLISPQTALSSFYDGDDNSDSNDDSLVQMVSYALLINFHTVLLSRLIME